LLFRLIGVGSSKGRVYSSGAFRLERANLSRSPAWIQTLMRLRSTSEISADVSPYWLGDPGMCLLFRLIRYSALSGFPPTDLLFGRSLPAPLMWLRPLQGTTRAARWFAIRSAGESRASNSHGVFRPSDA
jgi:hypothetical protein